MSRANVAECPVCEVHTESVYRVDGMDCHEEVALLERHLRHLPGLERFSADVVSGRLRVAHDAARLSASQVAEAVAATGMRAWLEHEQPVAASIGTGRRRVFVVAASGAAFLAGLAAELAGGPRPLAYLLYAVSIALAASLTARRALAAARSASFDINVLMLVAVAGALVLGEWSEAAAVIFLFALAQLLETRSMERARRAIRSLMELTPADALVRRPEGERRLPLDEVEVGDTLVVRPGERIALDGVVAAGASEVNQAPITGESMPVDKAQGDGVFAGSVNGHGALEVRVTRLSGDTTMARIIALVEVAQAQRAPSQAFVERFARYYTPAVLATAAAIAVLPSLAFGQPFGPWFYRALVLLVISCPCALVISTPVSFVSALAAAARRGVLVKGGVHLERAAALGAMAFDKTGTLTRGRPEVVGVQPLNGTSPERLLGLAAALEARSEHPIARAIIERAAAGAVAPPPGEAFRALPGLGAEASIEGAPVLVGNHRLFEARGLCSPAIDARLEELGRQGTTAVLVARGNLPIGIIGVADKTREAGRSAILELRRAGLAHLVMLTGDHERTARAIADGLGVDEVRAELLPGDKVEAVKELRRRFGSVAMVGDGVNDAPALAAADLGIAMGAAGSGAALETADVALMSDDLLKLPYLVRLGRRTLFNVKTNVAFSLGVKALFLALAVTGAATLWMAVAADMGASLLVVANGLRLLRTE
ncbi:MAG TPA: heavy metal translocating P-type ATPase [Vicinamibacterales bacterium]|nr:heavy metal translocating P-type ATPase [Vicinamibacterales bacterium]